MRSDVVTTSLFRFVIVAMTLLSCAAPAGAQDGAALYQIHCALCHDRDDEGEAPGLAAMRQLSASQVLVSLERGAMSRQGADRSRAERRALAEFVSGKTLGDEGRVSMPRSAYCTAPASARDRAGADLPSWNGWGVTTANVRFQTAAAAGLAPDEVPKLQLAWAFGFPGASSAGAQPVVWNGRVFVGSWEGDFYAIDARTGCLHWTIEIEAGVRSAATVMTLRDGRVLVLCGDLAANMYGVDAETGRVTWKVRVDDQPFARITGSPTLHDRVLYVPVASREESQASDPRYQCCRFRGSLVALDAATGRRIWKSYTISEQAKPTRSSAAGTQLWGPSGSAIWVAPTIDVQQSAIYVGTSNAYSAPPTASSDAIVAFDLQSGRIRWTRQMTPNDMWNGSCPERAADHSSCPDTSAPDFDFAASPVLVRSGNGRLLLAAQKSGVVYALDPDREGKVVWETRIGRGGTSGGIMWGPASDRDALYVALSDAARLGRSSEFDPTAGGGLFALSLRDGRRLWSTPAPPCGERRPCAPTQAAAVTAIPGIVFSGSNDGALRAYAAKDGRIVWTYDTVREFTTVNGIPAKGGSINNGGPAVAGGMVFTNAGYSHHSGVIPGNVLLAFTARAAR